MKNVPSASSSDLDLARDLSRRLRPGDAPGAPGSGAPPEEGAFVRFRAADVRPPGPGRAAHPAPRADAPVSSHASPSTSAPPVAVPPDAPPAGATWEALLEWCCGAGAAHSAFLVDAQGLVVAARGALSAEAAEGVGSRMLLALEHARRIQHPGARSPSVAIDLGENRISAFAVELGDGSGLTIGLIGPHAVDPAARSAIGRAFRARS